MAVAVTVAVTVAVAAAVLNVTLGTVRDLLMEETRFLFNVRDEVEEIGTELKRMRDFLERADAKKDEDRELCYRVAVIRELANEVGDVLETFAIEVASQKRKGGIKKALKRSVCIDNECIGLHEVGSKIVSIKTKITNFTSSLATYKIPGEGEGSDSRQERQQQLQNYPHFEDDFVGMEDDIKQLVFQLVNEEANCKVVSIYGMGGLGKTSLAKQVYNHDEVRRHFTQFSWTCISQQWKTTTVLQEILKGLVPTNKEEIMRMTNPELFKEIYEVQKKEKCLVVIDDIWSIVAWDCLRQAFPIGATHSGSKILLTTRDKGVALCLDPSVFPHQPQCLTEEQAWELLQRKAFPRRDIGTEYTIDPRMEELGKEMVRQCKSLPLAVVVLGGILVTRHTYEEWEVVLEDIKTYLARGEGVSGKNGGVSSVLALSYNSLPYHLKPCFLFLANFSEDSDIKATKLYRLWLAERIVSSDYQRQGQTMMDVAEDYLFELAQRCMVQVRVKTKNIARRRLKSCRLHDLMRVLCLSKVKEENFLKLIGSGTANEECSTSLSSNITKTRRLAIHSNDNVGEYEMYLEKQRASHVRSLLIFEGGEGFLFKIKDSLKCFKLLSVLDLESVKADGLELPKAIGKIVLLRYLSLRKTGFKKLPSSIGKLGYLETLDLRTYGGTFVPNVLWQLQRLRHLYLPHKILIDDREKEKRLLRLDGLNNLETLVMFGSYYFNVEDLLKLNNLRKLQATVTKREDLAHFVTAVSSTNLLLRQSNLMIIGYSFQSEDELNVLRKLIGCRHLNKLSLEGGPISKLPEHCDFSPNLTRLILGKTKLEDDPMPILGKLPSLVDLRIGTHVFMGKEVVCSSTDFLQLTSLVIGGLLNLENWTVDQGAFPKLSHCEIIRCPNLRMIPDGFAFLTALKTLDIRNMSKILVDRVVVKGVDGKEGEDYHKLQHIPSIYIDWIPLNRFNQPLN